MVLGRELQHRMTRLGVREEDLEERFIRSAGPGGQHVNKVATCVVLRHRPSGLEVRCQHERSQARNRALARWLLLERLEARRLETFREEAERIATIRRQRRKRPRQVKERLLAAKRRRAEKKTLRRRPRGVEG